MTLPIANFLPERRCRILLAVIVAMLAMAVIAMIALYRSNHEVSTGGPEVREAPPVIKPVELIDIAPDVARTVNARRALSKGPLIPAPQLFDRRDEQDHGRAVDCLAAAAWYEAGDDPVGQRSVIQTVLNRARHPAFPNRVCSVVFQGAERRTGCQFTFTCDGALVRTPSSIAWARAQALARQGLGGVVDRDVGLATHYHTDWVLPVWSGKLEKIAKVRTHLFFRWPGAWGTKAVFRGALAAGEPLVAALGRLSPNHAGGLPGAPLIGAPGAEEASVLAPVRFTDHRVSIDPGAGDDVFFVALDPARGSGSHAISAVNVCGKRKRCLVLGWIDHASISKQLPLTESAIAKLSFVYRRTDSGDAAYWDCKTMPRESAKDCLPTRVVEVRTVVNRP